MCQGNKKERTRLSPLGYLDYLYSITLSGNNQVFLQKNNDYILIKFVPEGSCGCAKSLCDFRRWHRRAKGTLAAELPPTSCSDSIITKKEEQAVSSAYSPANYNSYYTMR